MTLLNKIILPALLLLFLSACSQEQQNQISRIGVTWLEGNYRVTFAEGTHIKIWFIKEGKVTSEADKGYYYFWATENGKKIYVQTPISRSYIEEMP